MGMYKGKRESEQEYLYSVFPVLLQPLNLTLERSLSFFRWWNEPSLHLCYTLLLAATLAALAFLLWLYVCLIGLCSFIFKESIIIIFIIFIEAKMLWPSTAFCKIQNRVFLVLILIWGFFCLFVFVGFYSKSQECQLLGL